MTAFLSDAWLERLAELGAELPEAPDMAVRVLHVVQGTPDGEMRYQVVYQDGRVVSAEGGEVEVGDGVSITTKYPDAKAVLTGDADANALFMSGRAKVTGSTGQLLSYLSLTGTADHEVFREALAAETEF